MKIAMLFPGYGSQYLGMSKELYDESRIVQEYFEQAGNCLGSNFVKVCFASSDVQINSIEYAYTSLFLVSSALYTLFEQEGIVPHLVTGYPMGHYAALFAAGSITFADGLYFLNKYATFYIKFLKDLSVRCIRVVGLDTMQVQQLCEQKSGTYYASVAVYLNDTECIISGHTLLVDDLEIALKEYKGVSSTHVAVGVGLHSPIMQPVADQLKVYLPKIDLQDLKVPLVSSIGAQQITSSEQATTMVIEQITLPIRWDLVVPTLHDYDVCIEVGPGDVLTKLIKEYYPDKLALSVHTLEGINEVKHILNTNTSTRKLNDI